MNRIVVLFHTLGPYHWARLDAAASHSQVTGIELYAESAVYAWEKLSGNLNFERVTLFSDRTVKNVRRPELIRRVHDALDHLAPNVVAIPGWSDKGALAALCWCARNKIPAILMSESSEHDEPRRVWKESIKRRIVAIYSAALVGGKRHREYLELLGFPCERIFEGYDVVDNAHFERAAATARSDAATLRGSMGLPEKYFLASCRFVAKKNLPRLLSAYAAYKSSAGADAWKFVLLGDGPLRHEVEAQIRELGLRDHVALPGFKQYRDLPSYYGLAGAFVHASTSEQWGLVVNEAMASGLPVLVSERCGCAPELIINGRNGFIFDPDKVEELSRLMLRIAGGGCDLSSMGMASRAIIAAWSPEKFASGLSHAIEAARSKPRQRVSPVQQCFAELLTRL